MQVKFFDLKVQYNAIKSDIDEAIHKVLDDAIFYDGAIVSEFERTFAEKHKAKYCVAVNSGTAALHASLLALNINPGDEVIVPSNSYFATAEAVSLAGATPVMVDCEAEFFGINSSSLRKSVTQRTKAIIPVHLYGQAANIKDILCIAEEFGLEVIEDCAHAHLATFDGQPVGTFGKTGCFSFFPGKNLGAYGEGGAIVTNDEKLVVELKKIRTHGADNKYNHDRIGHHYRLESLQGAVLHTKLKYLDTWTAKRRENAQKYFELLKDCRDVILPQVAPGNNHVYHLYVIRTKKRDKLRSFLMDKGVETGLHYPIPIHLQKAYGGLGYKRGDLPVSELAANEVLSLPISEQLTPLEAEYVADCIKKFFNKKGIAKTLSLNF